MIRPKRVTTYRGLDIFLDDDNIYHVKSKSVDYQFESLEDAEDFIDEIPAILRYSSSKKSTGNPRMYFIYVDGTYKNHRAKYLCKNGKSEFRNERDADKFTPSQTQAILRNSHSYQAYLAK